MNPMQMTIFDLLEPPAPPQPDYFHGRCACGWLLAGWHARAFDQDGWNAVRHLWIYVP